MYRFDAARQGDAPEMLVTPPYRPLWFFRAGSLVEFPPAVAYGKLYFANADGVLFAVDISKVKTVWAYRARRCTAATPAIDGHSIYMTFLNKPPCNASRSGIDGQVVALERRHGQGPVEGHDRAERVVAARGRRRRLCRRLERQGLRVQCRDREHALDVLDRRQGQGRDGLCGRPHLLRLLRPPRLRAQRAHRQALLARLGSAAARLARHLLLDARGRLRPRLHRLDRRQGLLLRRHEREAALVARHRRLRLLLAGGLASACLRRLLRRHHVRVRRGHR